MSLTASISATTAVIGGKPVSLDAGTITLPDNATSLVLATPTGYAITDARATPLPGTAVVLAKVTTKNGKVIEKTDLRTHGGVGNYNLKPANPVNAPAITGVTVSLAAEGPALATATITFSVTGMTALDDSIGSFEVVQAVAESGQWGNPHVLAWSPTETTWTDYRYGLSAAQGYDLGLNILGRNGVPLNSSPLLISENGASPSISSEAIALALNLDQIADGTTYARTKAAGLDSGYATKTGGGSYDIKGVGDSQTLSLDSEIADGAMYQRTLATALTDGQVDLSQSGVIHKTLDYISDGASRGAVLETELAGSSGSYTVKQLNDGTNVRTAAVVATAIDDSGNVIGDVTGSIEATASMPTSSPLNDQGSLGNWAQIPSVSYTTTTTSIGITIAASTLIRTDGSSVSVSAFSESRDDLSANTVYLDVWYATSTNTFGWSVYEETPPTSAQIQADGFVDGRVPILVAYEVALSSSGSGSANPPVLSGPQCPLDYQLVETLERGRIRADALRVGMHLPKPGGAWTRIISVGRMECNGWEYTLEANGECDDPIAVNDTHMLLDRDGVWREIQYLAIDDDVQVEDGVAHIAALRELGPSMYVPIAVEEPHTFLLGRSITHNVVTFGGA